MPSLHSDLINNEDNWVQPVLDHAATLAVVGIAAATDAAATRLTLTNLSTRAPTLLAFTLAAEPGSIHCGHNLTLCPAELRNATPVDNKMILFVGDDLNSAIPVVFEDTATQRSNAGAA